VVDSQAERGISCMGETQCAARWARAIQWVQLNAGFPIATQTPTLVITQQPAIYGSRPGVTIGLEPQGYGYTRIDFAAGCGLFIPVCDPSVSSLRAQFAAYVMDDGAS
jgi:hypothetical protein